MYYDNDWDNNIINDNLFGFLLCKQLKIQEYDEWIIRLKYIHK